MALDKTTLKTSLGTMVDSLFALDPTSGSYQADFKLIIQDGIGDAVDVFVKSGTISTTVTVTSVSGVTVGAGVSGPGAGTGTGTIA